MEAIYKNSNGSPGEWYFLACLIIKLIYISSVLMSHLFWNYAFQYLETKDVNHNFRNYETQQRFSLQSWHADLQYFLIMWPWSFT